MSTRRRVGNDTTLSFSANATRWSLRTVDTIAMVAFALPIPSRIDAIRQAERLTNEVTGPMSVFLAFAAASWGLVMAVAPVLQIRRMVVGRSSDDVSLGYFGVLLPGFALWIGYGLTRADWALIVPNAAAFIVGAVTVAVGLQLRRSTPGSRRVDG
jgi:MtN3 and saliva related transmembrane protein